MINEVGSLRSEQAALNKLVRELTEQRHAKVMRDDRTTTTHTAPSLLDELRQAVAVGGEATGMGAAAPGSKLPMAANAADAMVAIEQRVLRMQLQASQAGGVTVESRLELIQSIVLGWSDAGDVAWANHLLRQVVELIANTLTPARRFTLRRPCPACGVAVVQTRDDLGETVMAPALTVDDRHGAHCAACDLRWPPEMVRQLAGLIEQQDVHARQLYEQARAEQDPEWEELDEDTRKAWREWRPDAQSVDAADGAEQTGPVLAAAEPRCERSDLFVSQCAHCKAAASSADECQPGDQGQDRSGFQGDAPARAEDQP